MFTNIAQVEALLSEEVAERVTWGKFVNWTGGLGNNIEGDKAKEICNCTSKNVVQRGMGSDKTNNTIITASKAAPGIHQIKGQFDKVTKIHPSSRAHTTRSAKDDEMLMLKDLRKLRPFRITPNRCHKQEITLSPLVGQHMEKFFSWLEKHKKQIAMG